MGKAVVLLSGGQDSTTTLYWAKKHFGEVHALTVHYGQTHRAELGAAAEIGALAGVASHVFVPLADLFAGSRSALVEGSGTALAGDGGMVDAAMLAGLPTSFVPGRNILLIAAAVSRAGAVGASAVVAGVCQTDYSGYPDCREPFITAMQRAIREAWPSGHDAPMIYTPLMSLTKAETVHLALSDGVAGGCMMALALTVTCYRGQRPGCGTCAACVLRVRGFADAGVTDPAAA